MYVERFSYEFRPILNHFVESYFLSDFYEIHRTLQTICSIEQQLTADEVLKDNQCLYDAKTTLGCNRHTIRYKNWRYTKYRMEQKSCTTMRTVHWNAKIAEDNIMKRGRMNWPNTFQG